MEEKPIAVDAQPGLFLYYNLPVLTWPGASSALKKEMACATSSLFGFTPR